MRSLWFGLILCAVALQAAPVCLAQSTLSEETTADTSTLAFVMLLHRHGDRAPITPDFNLAPGVFDAQWPLGCGELTGHGMIQLYDLGSALRATYVGPAATNPNFLPERYNSALHYTRSTDLHRTLQSSQSLLYGMYPGAGPVDDLTNTSLPGRYMPMPVSTVPKLQDDVLVAWDFAAANCKNYVDNYAAMLASSAWAKHQNATSVFLSQVGRIMNDTITIGWPVIETFDLWECDTAHGYLAQNYPDITPQMYAAMRAEAMWYWNQSMSWPKTIKRQMAGKIIGNLLSSIDAVIAYNASSGAPLPVRFLHYSAHDTTVMPLLVALEVFDGTPPAYAAHVIIEVRRSLAGEYFVRASYQNQSLVLPFCSQADCSYATEFRPHLLSFAVFNNDQFAQICQPMVPPPTPSAPVSDQPLIITIAALAALSAALAVALCMSRRTLASLMSTSDVEASYRQVDRT